MAGFLTVEDINFKEKIVLVRVDFNVLDDKGNIKDEKRIRETVPTLELLLKKGAKQLILMTHIGRPKGFEEFLKTDKVAARLSEMMNVDVKKADGYGEKGLPDSRIIMLENLRFNPAEESEEPKKRKAFAKQLASLADVYVNDAFASCHDKHVSMVDVPLLIKGCAGLLVEKEMKAIQPVLDNPERPYVSIIGGAKADKLDAVQNMLKKADKVLIGGALAFIFLKLKGFEVGATKIDEEGLKENKKKFAEILKNEKLVLPVDAVLADRFDNHANTRIVDVDSIEHGWMALDIGPKTAKMYRDIIAKAKTVVWNGPMGVFEFDKFANGTKEVAKAIADSKATSIVGGGDSAKAVKQLGFEGKVGYVSTGGGASLMMFEGKKLVAIAALEKSKRKFG